MATIAAFGEKPPILSGLVTDGDVYGVSINLTWTIPERSLHFATEIWASTTNDRGASALVATVVGNQYAFPCAKNSTYYFWIRALSIYQQVPGDFFPVSATSGVSGVNKEVSVLRGPWGSLYTGDNSFHTVALAYATNPTKYNAFATLLFTAYLSCTDSSTAEFALMYDIDEESQAVYDNYGPVTGTQFVTFSKYVVIPANMGEMSKQYLVDWKGSSANIQLKNPSLSIFQSY